MARRALRKQRGQPHPEDSSSSSSSKCIINISSLHATKGGIGASTYASAKAGVITLTRAMAAEGSLSASGAAVRANVIVPGYIDTEMLDGIAPFLFFASPVFLKRYAPLDIPFDSRLNRVLTPIQNSAILFAPKRSDRSRLNGSVQLRRLRTRPYFWPRISMPTTAF